MFLTAGLITFIGLSLDIALGFAKNPNAWIIPVVLLPFNLAFLFLINKAKKAKKFHLNADYLPLAICFFPLHALISALIKWTGILGPSSTRPIVSLVVVCGIVLIASPLLNKLVASWLGVPNALSKNYDSSRSVE